MVTAVPQIAASVQPLGGIQTGSSLSSLSTGYISPQPSRAASTPAPSTANKPVNLLLGQSAAFFAQSIAQEPDLYSYDRLLQYSGVKFLPSNASKPRPPAPLDTLRAISQQITESAPQASVAVRETQQPAPQRRAAPPSPAAGAIAALSSLVVSTEDLSTNVSSQEAQLPAPVPRTDIALVARAAAQYQQIQQLHNQALPQVAPAIE